MHSKLSLGLACGWQGHKHLSHHHRLTGTWSRKLGLRAETGSEPKNSDRVHPNYSLDCKMHNPHVVIIMTTICLRKMLKFLLQDDIYIRNQELDNSKEFKGRE